MWLVNLNYNFEYDWLIELSNNKVSDNKLASKLVESRRIEEIVILWLGLVITEEIKDSHKAGDINNTLREMGEAFAIAHIKNVRGLGRVSYDD